MASKCIRCETLGRPQKGRIIYKIVSPVTGEPVPLCQVCVVEISEEDNFFNSIREEEEDELGSEGFDQ